MLYCSPRARTGCGRGAKGGGLYPELAAFRMVDGCTPALQETVGRHVALLPINQALRELTKQGLRLDEKTVHRIANQLGTQVLTARTRDLLRFRAGELPAGTELSGKRIAVQIDGGRIRLREAAGKRRGKGNRRKFKAQWREPRLLTIYELDDKGQMKRGTRALIDATLQGADHLIELLAFHLHCLGAAKARSVTFVTDGATWIWDRLPWVVHRLGLKDDQVNYVLDWYHAVHHISLALQCTCLSANERKPLFRQLRNWLKSGCDYAVVGYLRDLADKVPKNSQDDFWTNIDYLKKHAPHMRYHYFRRHRLPIGSGAIESSVRRVLNLRLKGNSIYWRKENAEAILVLRAAVLTERWDDVIKHARDSIARDRRLDWKWEPLDILAEITKLQEEASRPIAQTACA